MRDTILRHCGLGYGLQAASVGNDSYVSLFNNSMGPQFLALRDLQVVNPSNAIINAWMQRGQLGTALTSSGPVVFGEAPPPGVVCAGVGVISLPTVVQWAFGTNVVQGMPWQHETPLAVIPPGCSFVLSTVNTNTQLIASFWWEALTAEQLNPDLVAPK